MTARIARVLGQRRLEISDALRQAVLSAAREAYPEECCGLIEGEDLPAGWRVLAIHVTTNRADDPRRRFLVDPEAQFRLARELRGTERAIIGCYHSHPDGHAEPSLTDREGAACEDGFVWLIAAGAPPTPFRIAAYVSRGEGFDPVALAAPNPV